MARHPSLVPLSHDHHHGLVAAQRLKRAQPAAAGVELADSVARLWREELAPHFALEESILFPACAGAGLDDVIDRAVADHRAMKSLIDAIASGEDRAVALGGLLEQHIRFEERELFPLIEQRLAPDLLAAVADAFAARR